MKIQNCLFFLCTCLHVLVSSGTETSNYKKKFYNLMKNKNMQVLSVSFLVSFGFCYFFFKKKALQESKDKISKKSSPSTNKSKKKPGNTTFFSPDSGGGGTSISLKDKYLSNRIAPMHDDLNKQYNNEENNEDGVIYLNKKIPGALINNFEQSS